MKVDGFDWDAGNEFKNEGKHGLSREVIEAFFHGRIWVGKQEADDRGIYLSGKEWITADSTDQCALHACKGREEI